MASHSAVTRVTITPEHAPLRSIFDALSTSLTGQTWMDHAACAGTTSPDDWFGGDWKADAAETCQTCPVTAECRHWALADTTNEYGVWGGIDLGGLSAARLAALRAEEAAQ